MKFPIHLKEMLQGFLWKNKKWMIITFILMMITFPIEIILLSHLSGRIFVNMADMVKNQILVIRLILFFFLSYFVLELSVIARDYYDSYMIPELERTIRNQMIDMILEKNEIGYDPLAMGEVITRFLKTPSQSYWAYNVFFKTVGPFAGSLVIIGFYILILHWQIGLLFLGFLGLFLLIFSKIAVHLFIKTEAKMKTEIDMFRTLEDTLSNMHTILTSDTVASEKKFMDNAQGKFVREYRAELQIISSAKLFMSCLSLAGLVSMFLLAFSLYRRKKINQARLISITTLLLFLCRFLGYTTRKILDGMITIGSMLESDSFLAQLAADTVTDGTRDHFITQGEIRFVHVTFAYSPTSDPVFTHLDLTIPARSRIVLIGDSGSGKTTFVRLILGFFTLRQGKILVDNVDIETSRRAYLRKKIAYINQNTRLFNRTVMANIVYGTKATPDQVKAFVRTEHLEDIFRKIGPAGLDTMAGQGGENLSGGMRQIVLLLRCVFRDSPIVILDEATSSIDSKNRHHAIRILKKMFQTKTVIAVTHEKPIMDLFDLQLVFSSSSSPRLQRVQHHKALTEKNIAS